MADGSEDLRLNIQTLDWNGNEYLSGNISGADFITNDGNHKLSLKADTNAPLSGFAEDDEHRLVSNTKIAEWDEKITSSVLSSELSSYALTSLVYDEIEGIDIKFDPVLKNKIEDFESSAISMDFYENTDYFFGTLTSLSAVSVPSSQYETNIYFTTGTSTSVNLPSSLLYYDDYDISFDDNTRYVISIQNNVCIVGEIVEQE